MSQIAFIETDRAKNSLVKIRMIISAILSIPKTIWFNFRYLPIKTAIKFPVLLAYNVRVLEMHRGIISFEKKPQRFGVKIGFAGSDSIAEKRSSICLEKGSVIFKGKASFSRGVNLRNSGILRFGDNFYANKNCTIWCSKSISFGNNVLLGWNVTFRDSDGHMIIVDDQPHEISGNISIGNHSWICSECHILKNSSLGNESVLGYGSLLIKHIDEKHVLVAGWPAKIIRENVNWNRGK